MEYRDLSTEHKAFRILALVQNLECVYERHYMAHLMECKGFLIVSWLLWIKQRGFFTRIHCSFDYTKGFFDRIHGSFVKTKGFFTRIHGSFDRRKSFVECMSDTVGLFWWNAGLFWWYAGLFLGWIQYRAPYIQPMALLMIKGALTESRPFFWALLAESRLFSDRMQGSFDRIQGSFHGI